jgi:hypothetical protein
LHKEIKKELKKEGKKERNIPWFIMKRMSFSFRLFPMLIPSSRAVGIP